MIPFLHDVPAATGWYTGVPLPPLIAKVFPSEPQRRPPELEPEDDDAAELPDELAADGEAPPAPELEELPLAGAAGAADGAAAAAGAAEEAAAGALEAPPLAAAPDAGAAALEPEELPLEAQVPTGAMGM